MAAQESRTEPTVLSVVRRLVAADALLKQYVETPDSASYTRDYVRCVPNGASCRLQGDKHVMMIKVERLVGDTALVGLLLRDPGRSLSDSTRSVILPTYLRWTMIFAGGHWSRTKVWGITG
jgi:hypothetical protein